MIFKTQKAYDRELGVRRAINNTLSKRLSRRSVISQIKGGSSELFESINKKTTTQRLKNIKKLLSIK